MTSSRNAAWTALRFGVAKFSGFALSMALLSVAALAVIPSMIAAGGPEVWGRIAIGQSVGAVAAVVLALGWGVSGPAQLAAADPVERVRIFHESVVVRLMLALPMAGVTFVTAWLVAGQHRTVAGVAALTTLAVGLSGYWYFVGLARPYAYLLCETLPRLAGTCAAITAMTAGADVAVGLLLQCSGMVVAAVTSAVWILARQRASLPKGVLRRIPGIISAQRHGMNASVLSAVYAGAPVLLVGLVAPAALPAFALLNKVQRQVNAAASSYVTVLQAWVPAPRRSAAIADRSRRAMLLTLALCLVGGIAMFGLAPWLLGVLGGDQIDVDRIGLALLCLAVALSVAEAVYCRACLPARNRLRAASLASAVAVPLGLAAVVLGAVLGGVEGAMTGVTAGLLARLVLAVALSRVERLRDPARARRINSAEPARDTTAAAARP